MAQVDFADGQAHRAYASVALGLRILQAAGLNKDKYASSFSSSEMEARRRVAWAFFMLDRTYSASRDYSLCLSDKHFTLPFPSPNMEEAPGMEESYSRGTLHDGQGKEGEKVDHGILACLLRLYSLWGKATEYVLEPLDKDALPPWHTGSTLAMLESEWLQFETHFADKHRYLNVDFQRRAREKPECRGYLSTWVCVQFLFHSIQCLLYHPFVLMVKVRHMKGNLSTTFLQKSHENSLLHSRWIVRFIKEMNEVDFHLYDPFLGHLAAIAATIQLEHTVSKNPQVSQTISSEFKMLVDFMASLSERWENMRVLVDRVNELAARHHNYGSLFYDRDGYSGALSSMPTPSNIPRMSAEDEALMWDILDFGSSCTTSETTQLGDLIPSQSQGHHIESRPAQNVPDLPLPVSTENGENDRNVYQKGPAIPEDIPSPPPYGQVPESIGEDPIPGWTLPDANGNGGLDFPDWLILGGDMAEHL
ncbi:hypothetical protein PHISCL_00028 [Aspergillus sclerotialis]|uniref:Xylanolytic transcriptional activator regulatory domain-containing protein n=1 Tax=Aspergillus sclerotialis TaxID=2070753 RepID=A0A3A2ZZ32_9EURO|nr:hypothetical protein PHISCL_00028 [Aspergillus sclerotialis]